MAGSLNGGEVSAKLNREIESARSHPMPPSTTWWTSSGTGLGATVRGNAPPAVALP